MKKIVLSLVILASATSASAAQVGGVVLASASFAAFSMTFGTFASKSEAHHKLILNAQDDAAMFVATHGQVRGVQLQQALEVLRSENPALSASDMDVAQAIVNY